MASSSKRKTTYSKLARESRLRERRLDKQVRKAARKAAADDVLDVGVVDPEAAPEPVDEASTDDER